MFLKVKDEFKVIGGDANSVMKRLDTGAYKVSKRNEGFSFSIYLTPMETRNQNTMLKNGVFGEINEHLEVFFDPHMVTARKQLNSINKFACLIYGEQGSGKTHHAILWAQKIAQERDAISLVIDNAAQYDLSSLVESLRDNDPDRFVVLVLEEFEKTFHNFKDPDLLSFLDGANAKDNLIILATCNDVSKIPDVLLDRPGRFEKKFKLAAGNKDVMRGMIKVLIPTEYEGRIDTERIIDMLQSHNKWTIDYIRILLRNEIAELLFFDEHGHMRHYPDLFSNNELILASNSSAPAGSSCEDTFSRGLIDHLFWND